jgi:hypothetical protein
MSRTCEENLARRAWASAYHRQPPRLKHHLSYLLTVLTSPRPVYGRIAETALAQNDPKVLVRAIADVVQEIDHCRKPTKKVATTYPHRNAA